MLRDERLWEWMKFLRFKGFCNFILFKFVKEMERSLSPPLPPIAEGLVLRKIPQDRINFNPQELTNYPLEIYAYLLSFIRTNVSKFVHILYIFVGTEFQTLTLFCAMTSIRTFYACLIYVHFTIYFLIVKNRSYVI